MCAHACMRLVYCECAFTRVYTRHVHVVCAGCVLMCVHDVCD